MKIWIVHGTTGEYSDRTEWVVDAWPTEAEAQAKVTELVRLLHESGIERMRYGPEREQAIAAMRVHDPDFGIDYTGTSWYVSTCELHIPQSSGRDST